jgi:glycosyltransferase involved in cell wall biosynthesis
MDLSVIIPVHRNEATIRRTLESIDASWRAVDSPAGLAVIVVIDGDVDASHRICREWMSRCDLPASLTLQENAGIGSARNVGWRQATSAWVTFLDADDEITPTRLRFAMGPLETGAVYVGRQGLQVREGLRVPSLPGSDFGEHEGGRFYFISMLIERRTLDAVGGFGEIFTVGDDWDLMVRLRESGVPVEYIDLDFVIRHIHGGNASFDEIASTREYLRAIRAHVKRGHE